jgi:hypothetical protein
MTSKDEEKKKEENKNKKKGVVSLYKSISNNEKLH